MRPKIILILFGLTVAAQLFVPASMIFSSERVLSKGKTFRFRTAPIDPYDAFRGKFVALDFTASRTVAPADPQFETGTLLNSRPVKMFALIDEDDSGFARINELLSTRPDSGYFVKVTVNRWSGRTTRVQFPFSKFFLEEGTAQQAEDLYRKHNRRGKQNSFAIVNIDRSGHAVLADLVLGGVPVSEALRQASQSRQ
jgi:uncharacterized membrane-anchored protein